VSLRLSCNSIQGEVAILQGAELSDGVIYFHVRGGVGDYSETRDVLQKLGEVRVQYPKKVTEPINN
jgi:hypothetical protein